MNGLDILIVAVGLAAAIGGYRLGFVARMTSWVGMLLGIIGGFLVIPSIIDRVGNRVDRPNLVFVVAAAVLGAGLLGQAVGLFVGARLHLVIPPGPARVFDAVVGAVAGLLGVAITVWLIVPAMADVPDWPAQQARSSVVVQAMERVFPEAPDASRSVRRLLGERYPQVFDALRRAPALGPPPAASGLDAATARRVAASTVLVAGEACGQVQEGSGFVVGTNLVATNAHVVAGESTTEVETSDGSRHDGTVVAFDPERDLAIIRVPGLDRPALPVIGAKVGDKGAVFGHPGGGALRLAPFAVGQKVTAVGSDIYDNPGVRRDVLVLAAELRPGDSGSALVSPDGVVVGVAFAIAPDRPGVAYAVTTEELLAVVRTAGPRAVSAGDCIS